MAKHEAPPGGVEWRPVVGFDRYLVSPHGLVWSKISGRVLSQFTNPLGYKMLTLSPGSKTVLVHRLVAESYLGPSPDGLDMVLHGDGDPGNNHVSNLRWGSARDNSRDMLKHGRHAGAAKTHCNSGHPLDGENLYVPPGDGKRRRCRTCDRARERVRRAGGLPSDSERHGTNVGYTSFGCRCSKCRDAMSEYHRNYRRRGVK